MPVWMYLFSIVYCIALGGLLWVTRHKRKYYTLAKGSVSFLFVVAGVGGAFAGGGNKTGFWLLLAALLFCMAGDVLLGMANRTKAVRVKPFAGGALSFFVAHIFFCFFLYRQAAFQWYDFFPSVLLVLGLFLLEKAGLVRLKQMRLIGYGYSFVVALMACKAVQYMLAAPGAGGILLAAGAILFLVSDIILLFLYFGTHRVKWTRYANLSTYYIGVYCIALSAYWLP